MRSPYPGPTLGNELVDASTIYFDQEKLFKYAGLQKMASQRSLGGAQMLASGGVDSKGDGHGFGRSSFLVKKSFKASMI